RVAAGNALEDDAAAPFGEPLPQDLQRLLDPREVVVRCDGEVLGGQRLGGDDEQRLQRAGQLVDGIRRDQAERTFHGLSPSPAIAGLPALWMRIGANGAACSMRI